MRPLSLLAQTADAPADFSILKWASITNIFLWVGYLIKEIFFGHKQSHASATELKALTDRVTAMEARAEKEDARFEQRMNRVYDHIDVSVHRISKSFETLAKDVARVEGELHARKGES